MARAKKTQQKRANARLTTNDHVVATNRRARHDYLIIDTLECGIVLTGSEVKSLREGRAQIAEGYARVDDNELWLFQTHIPPWMFAVGFGSHDPDRRRKLLVHRQELEKWAHLANTQQLTMIPLRVFFKDGRVKVELGLAKGKTLYDRRRALAESDAKMEMARATKWRQYQD